MPPVQRVDVVGASGEPREDLGSELGAQSDHQAVAGLPSPYLAKIMQALARGGVLDSFRGRGYALPRPPEEVFLRDVIRAIDGDDAFWVGCIFWREECSETRPCPLHFQWRELKPEFTQVMGSITLADIRDRGAARRFKPVP